MPYAPGPGVLSLGAGAFWWCAAPVPQPQLTPPGDGLLSYAPGPGLCGSGALSSGMRLKRASVEPNWPIRLVPGENPNACDSKLIGAFRVERLMIDGR